MAAVAGASSPSAVAPSSSTLARGRAVSMTSPSTAYNGPGGDHPPMTKIQWTAMMLKAKVAGPQPTETKQPIKINQYSFEPAPKVADLATKLATKKKSKMPEGYGSVGSNKEAIQRMIAMREDPAFSPKNQPIPVSSAAYTPSASSRRPAIRTPSSSSSASEAMLSSSLPSSLSSPLHLSTPPSSLSAASSSSTKKSFAQHHPHHHPHPENESRLKDQGSGSVVPGIEQPLLTGRRRNVAPLVPSMFSTGASVTGDSFSIERLQQSQQENMASLTQQPSGNSARTVAPAAAAEPSVVAAAQESPPTKTTTTGYSSPSPPPPSCSPNVGRKTKDSESTRSTRSSVTATASPPSPTSQPNVSADAIGYTSLPITPTSPLQPQQPKADEHSASRQKTNATSTTDTPASTKSLSICKKRDSIRAEEQRPPLSSRRHTLGSSYASTETPASNTTTTTTTKTPPFSFLNSPPPSPAHYRPPTTSLSSSGQTSSTTSRLPPSPSSLSSPSRTTLQTNLTTTPSPMQTSSAINSALRQLQTPHIPVNLVQARIQQKEEKKRQDEELAKIPITANLRSVKKIHAIMVDDLTPPSPSSDGTINATTTTADLGSLSVPGTNSSRPRSRTTSAAQDFMPGGKRRGDRTHIEAVAIPKSLAEKVEGILSRKIAGKGCLLDDMEKLREEEEMKAAKAATLPPIVRGQPRKRALTSSHIKSLVSSWDTKVEVANQTTLEAERSRKFLEERSHARAELPKFLGINPLVQPPAMPAPPSPPTSGRSSPTRRAVGAINTTSITTTNTTTKKSFSSAPSSRAVSPVNGKPTLKKNEEEEESASETKTASKPMDNEAKDMINQNAENERAEQNAPEAKLSSSCPLAVPEIGRSGEVLVHKAIVSRPRRKNVRAAT